MSLQPKHPRLSMRAHWEWCPTGLKGKAENATTVLGTEKAIVGDPARSIPGVQALFAEIHSTGGGKKGGGGLRRMATVQTPVSCMS